METAIEPQPKKGFSLIVFFSVCLALVMLFSFLRFYVFKNYDMTIEVACDPETESCFARDCETEECPPNNLADYKIYTIKAYQFDKCETDTCARFCENPRNCEKIECDSDAGDTCSGPESAPAE